MYQRTADFVNRTVAAYGYYNVYIVFGSRSCNFNGMTGVLCFYNRVIKKRTIYALVNMAFFPCVPEMGFTTNTILFFAVILL